MGGLLSYFWTNTGRTDDPDPATGLTSRDKYIITTTWQKLSSGEAGLKTGRTIFIKLFEKYPQYQELFPFRGVPLDELKTQPRFDAHCSSVMFSLSSVFLNVNSPSMLQELLLRQGINHVPRKVPRGAYEQLKGILMDIFSGSMTQEELTTWDKFLGLGFSIMAKGADSVQKK